ncbi:peptidoglycan-binding protein [Chryseobacterium sp. T16E-39]|uniref:N-acetylmuramidase family protein n=1 Tax=Chryseobacterium sp. T16E-39 TaxID=2015076 RepID=UPI000B5B37F7|nr:N-acetylmuramidase family protein [Chryseobacterium sp. T16E-39]ASK29716.1 peptidoglycan-binding protein [Chryseobacterium sp. T16E-39]
MKTLTEQDYINAAKELGCEVAAIKAVSEVEGRGSGFFANGAPKILFERHKFYKYTNGAFAQSNPDLCNRTPGGYGKESEQHSKLQRAVELNRDAALMSCSWGTFQVMGEHWKTLGYSSIQDFVNKMYRSEADHLDSFVRYIKAFGLTGHLRNKNWAAFAKGYNGPGYKANNYDVKMAVAYNKYKN